jgi:hypothetical protein
MMCSGNLFFLVTEVSTPFGANKNAEELLATPPRRTGQTGASHRSDRCCREDPARDQRTSSGHDPVGAAHAGLSYARQAS